MIFFSHHVQTGNIADFHSKWIQSGLDNKIAKKLVIAPREHAKSTIFSLFLPIYVTLYQLKKFIVLVSDSSGQSQLFLGNIKREFEENRLLKYVYGSLIQAEVDNTGVKTKKWNVKELLTATGVRMLALSNMQRVRGIKDMATRPDMIIIDDIESEVDSESDIKGNKSWQWFLRTLMNLGSRDTKFLFVGTQVSETGVINRIVNGLGKLGWDVDKFSIYKSDGSPMWVEWWTPERIKNKILEIGEIAFRNEFMNDPTAIESTIFDEAAIEASKDRSVTMVDYKNEHPWLLQFQYIVAGVDLAISIKKTADEFAMCVLGVMQNGIKVILNLKGTKIKYPEQKDFIKSMSRAFNIQLILVENNQYQDALVQDMNELTDLPIYGQATGSNKTSEALGVNSIAVEVKNGKMVLPYGSEDNSEIDKLISSMKKYPIGHTGDRLMAYWLAVCAARQVEENIKKVQKARVSSTLSNNNHISNSSNGNNIQSDTMVI